MKKDKIGIWTRLYELAKSQKKSLKSASKYTGVSEGTISGWKESWPTVEKLSLIAGFYQVSLDYLLYDNTQFEKNPKFSMEVLRIGEKLASLDPNDRQDILDFIDIKLKKGKKGDKMTEAITTSDPEPAYFTDIKSIPIRQEVIDNVIFHEWGVIEVPLLGSTAAGQPIDFGDIDPNPPTRPWAASLIQGDLDSYYCVTVRGESMTEADIKDGDHALLRHAESPKNGEIMLVRHDNSSTLKRIKIVEKNGQEEVYICWEDGSKRRVKLKGDGYEIQGLLVAIERKPGKR